MSLKVSDYRGGEGWIVPCMLRVYDPNTIPNTGDHQKPTTRREYCDVEARGESDDHESTK